MVKTLISIKPIAQSTFQLVLSTQMDNHTTNYISNTVSIFITLIKMNETEEVDRSYDEIKMCP